MFKRSHWLQLQDGPTLGLQTTARACQPQQLHVHHPQSTLLDAATLQKACTHLAGIRSAVLDIRSTAIHRPLSICHTQAFPVPATNRIQQESHLSFFLSSFSASVQATAVHLSRLYGETFHPKYASSPLACCALVVPAVIEKALYCLKSCRTPWVNELNSCSTSANCRQASWARTSINH